MHFSVHPPEAGELFFWQHGINTSPSYGLAYQSASNLSLRSELNEANAVLEGLYFIPALNFFGPLVVNINANDGAASGQGGVLSASSTIDLSVVPVNDSPDIVVPRVHRRSGGQGPQPIESIHIDDVDDIVGESLTVSITTYEGTIAVDPSHAVMVVNVSGESDNTISGLTLTGLLPDVRRALLHVWFVPPSEGWEGGSSVTFFASDGHGATGTTECVVVVSDPSIQPVITAEKYVFPVDQGTHTPLLGLSVEDLVADVANSVRKSSPVFNVTVATKIGRVGLIPVPPGLSPVPGSETAETAVAALVAGKGLKEIFGTPRSTLSFRGTLSTVNAALGAITYLSENGTMGLGNHSVTIDVKRRGKAQEYSARHELVVNVRPAKQSPDIFWNATAYNPELPEVGGFSLRGLGVVDNDLPEWGILSVQLEAISQGYSVVVRSASAGIKFSRGSPGGVPSSVIAFRGNATSIADAISASAIIPNTPGVPRTLTPFLRVTVADGNGGETSRVVEVYGERINSSPEIEIETQRIVLKESGALERIGELCGVSIHDIDVEDSDHGILEVNISVSHHAVLEVQKITTSAKIIHPVQIVTISSSSSGNSTIGGTFNLTLDLTNLCEDCGTEEAGPIWHDAVGNEDDARAGLGSGSETGESIQAKFEGLLSLQTLDIAIFCQRDTALGSQSGHEWRVTFLGASAALPMMHAIGDSLSGDTPSVQVTYGVKGNSLSGKFALSVGGYKTESIRYDANAGEVASALEALPSVNAVEVTTPYAHDPQGGRQWEVTFVDAMGTAGDLPLMEVDGQELGGRGASIDIVETVNGEGKAELWEVVTSAAHRNLVNVVTMTSALHAQGYFQLGLDYGGRHAWSRPVYPQAVGPISDEDGSWLSFGGTPGHKHGESVEARILSLENWNELGPEAEILVKRVESMGGDNVKWDITFTGAPEDLEVLHIRATRLTGGAVVSVAVATTHNRVQGFFTLAHGGSTTSPLAHDSTGGEIAAALNAMQSLHSSNIGTGVVSVTRTQETTLEGGRRWLVAFLSDPEIPANFTAAGTSATGLTGASARASVTLVRRGGRGAILRLVDLGGVAFGIPGYTIGERLTVRGKPDVVTRALSSLSYTPRREWNGGVMIIFRAFDHGFTGAGGAQAGSGVIFAKVEPINNPPEVLWCGNVLSQGGLTIEGVEEDAPLRLVDYDCEGGGTSASATTFDHIDLGGPDLGLQIRNPNGGASQLKVIQEQ